VVTTERFLSAARTKPKHLKALRDHVRKELRWRRGSPTRTGGSRGSAERSATSPRP
jgi:hypothetical protein